MENRLANHIGNKQLTDIVRIMELALYRRADSRVEYNDRATLEKRMEYLALVGYPPCFRKSTLLSSEKKTSILKNRKRKSFNTLDRMMSTTTTLKAPLPTTPRSHYTKLFLQNREDLIQEIFSYVDGKTTIRCTVLNSFAASFLPKCVVELKITSTMLSNLYGHSITGGFFAKCSNLKTLELSAHASIDLSPAQKVYAAPVLDTISTHQCYCCNTVNAESTLFQLANTLATGAFPKLVTLSITSVFFNSLRINAASALSGALRRGVCPNLKILGLSGNGLCDAGVVEFSTMLAGGHCPQLEVLDLRKNFIGEKGMHSLSQALGHIPALKQLALGGNIITASSLRPVLASIAAQDATSLKALGLDVNFIDKDGIADIINTLQDSKGCPSLQQLLLGKNGTLDMHTDTLLTFVARETTSCPRMKYLDLGYCSVVNATILDYWKSKIDFVAPPFILYTMKGSNLLNDFTFPVLPLRFNPLFQTHLAAA